MITSNTRCIMCQTTRCQTVCIMCDKAVHVRSQCSIHVATKGKTQIFIRLGCKVNDKMVAEEEMQQKTLLPLTSSKSSSSASTDRVVQLNIKQGARPPIGPPDAPSPPPPAKNPPGKPSRLNLPPPPPPPVS